MVDGTRSVDPAEKLREAGAEEQEGEGRDVDAAGRLSAAAEVFRFQVGDTEVRVPVRTFRQMVATVLGMAAQMRLDPLVEVLGRPSAEQLQVATDESMRDGHRTFLDRFAREIILIDVKLVLAANKALLLQTVRYLIENESEDVRCVLAERDDLAPGMLMDLILATGDNRVLLALAHRSDLLEDQMLELIARGDVGVHQVLAAKSDFSRPVFLELIDRGEELVLMVLAARADLLEEDMLAIVDKDNQLVWKKLLKRQDLPETVLLRLVAKNDEGTNICIIKDFVGKEGCGSLVVKALLDTRNMEIVKELSDIAGRFGADSVRIFVDFIEDFEELEEMFSVDDFEAVFGPKYWMKRTLESLAENLPLEFADQIVRLFDVVGGIDVGLSEVWNGLFRREEEFPPAVWELVLKAPDDDVVHNSIVEEKLSLELQNVPLSVLQRLFVRDLNAGKDFEFVLRVFERLALPREIAEVVSSNLNVDDYRRFAFLSRIRAYDEASVEAAIAKLPTWEEFCDRLNGQVDDYDE